MPGTIDFETMDVDELTPVWWPSDADLTPDQYDSVVQQEARAHLLTMLGVPEAILRLLVRETEVSRVARDVAGQDDGKWSDFEGEAAADADADADAAADAESEAGFPPDSFEFSRPIVAETVEMTRDGLLVIYRLEGSGTWRMFLESERVTIERV
jgi:hypothetical protein